MKPYPRYSFLILVFVLCQSVAIAGFNIAIDPYQILNSPLRLGVNKIKPEKDKQVRLFKAIDIIRIRPKMVFLGSSRTEFGLDPSHPVLANHQPAYNLGLPGGNMYEARRYFQHALFVQPELKLVVIDIDVFMFTNLDENKPDFLESRLEKNKIIFQDLLDLSFSLNTFGASFSTITANKKQSNEAVGFFYPNGLRDAAYYKKYVYGKVSMKAIFENFIKTRPFFQQINIYRKAKISPEFLNDLKTLVSLCKEQNIELKILISPSHVTQWEALRVAGLSLLVEEWKREIVKIVPVWDFSGYNTITSEPINNQMKYYLDSSHYLPSVGNLVLNRIFQDNEESVPKDFGAFVTPENIESHMENLRSEREAWAKNNPDVVQWVEGLAP